MDMLLLKKLLLNLVNDDTAVHPYGSGSLVELPLTYADGDSVQVLVEPVGDGLRVSDMAETAARLITAGVSLDSEKPAKAFAEAVRRIGRVDISAAEDELATVGEWESAAQMILAVGQESLRLEQLRWLAQSRRATFAERVQARLASAARQEREVRPNAPLTTKHGRARKVTAAVHEAGRSAYIQAVNSATEQSVDHCLAIFSTAEVPLQQRVAALSGSPNDWQTAVVKQLSEFGQVEFFANPLGLEDAVSRALSPVGAKS